MRIVNGFVVIQEKPPAGISHIRSGQACTDHSLLFNSIRPLSTGPVKHIDRIGHIHIAGVPGRHEPDFGEIKYPYLFELLDELGYDGWVGAEYRPRAGTVQGLGWARGYGIG
jgi:hypothetical protein